MYYAADVDRAYLLGKRARRLVWAAALAVAAGAVLIPWAGAGSAQAVAAQDAEAELPPLPEGTYRPWREGTRLNARSLDGERVSGVVVQYTVEDVTYLDNKDQRVTTAWSDLAPADVGRFAGRLVAGGDAAGQLVVAEVLINAGAEAELIERSLARAEDLDQALAHDAQALRGRIGRNAGGGDGDTPIAPDGEAGGDAPGAETPGGNAPEPEIDNPRAWPELTDEQHGQAVTQIKAGVDEVLQKMNREMAQTETERFVVYTDLEAREARYWVSLLDRMYVRMCEVFDLDPEQNIWKGKCLLMLFKNQQDYLLYNATAYGNNASGSAGICYQFGNGLVHIAMFRQQDEKQLAHTLVHEASHGFLFRYQSSFHVPNWLNEGLAEYIATALVDSGRSDRRAADSRLFVKQRGSFDNFLSAQNIIGQHYGLAYDVTDMMVVENRRNYVRLIQGIKQGKTVEQAFEQDYGVEMDRVLAYYLQTRVRDTSIRLR